MRLLKVETTKDIKERLRKEFEKILKVETRDINNALGFYLAEDIKSPTNVPAYNKSRVDGYAVKFSDCKIASETSPCILNLVGALNIGDENKTYLKDNECMYIPTGGMLPLNADAMVMIEHTEKLGENLITINKSTTLNQNITFVGDDVKIDNKIANRGIVVDERLLGVCTSLNIKKVVVYKPLTVFILSSGDELVDSYENITLGQTIEINSIFLSIALTKANFNIIDSQLIKDDKSLYKNTIVDAINKYTPDIIITSGGSSKGDKDYTISVFDELTENVFCEGIAVKPGKPTILATKDDRLFIGLPGHPVSSYMVLKNIILTSYFDAIGYKRKAVVGELVHNVANSNGRETMILCNTTYRDNTLLVEPIYFNSTNIGTLSNADGYFIIGENAEGLNEHQKVEVFYFD